MGRLSAFRTLQGVVLGCFVVLAAAFPAAAQTTFVEDFSTGNEGSWTFGTSVVIETTGGNPGEYLHESVVDTYAPQPRTTSANNEFTGDYRARGVTAIGCDLITIASDFTAAGRPLTVILVNNNGTPNDQSDDLGAYYVGSVEVPEAGTGWTSFDFVVPSQETTLPAGWLLLDYSGAGNPQGDWNDVITDVDQVRFFYGDPDFFFIFMQWNVGLDNPRITVEGASGPEFIRGDADQDGSLNALVDSLVILNYGFLPGSTVPPCLAAADCDGDDSFNALLDGLYLLNFGFVPGSPPIPAPYPDCGEDTETVDALGCDAPLACP